MVLFEYLADPKHRDTMNELWRAEPVDFFDTEIVVPLARVIGELYSCKSQLFSIDDNSLYAKNTVVATDAFGEVCRLGKFVLYPRQPLLAMLWWASQEHAMVLPMLSSCFLNKKRYPKIFSTTQFTTLFNPTRQQVTPLGSFYVYEFDVAGFAINKSEPLIHNLTCRIVLLESECAAKEQESKDLSETVMRLLNDVAKYKMSSEANELRALEAERLLSARIDRDNLSGTKKLLETAIQYIPSRKSLSPKKIEGEPCLVADLLLERERGRHREEEYLNVAITLSRRLQKMSQGKSP
jgi:hypothetical protein